MPFHEGPIAVGDSVLNETAVNCLKSFLEGCPYPEAPPQALTATFWTSLKDGKKGNNPIDCLIHELFEKEEIKVENIAPGLPL